jgi:hypothetical protein
MLEIGNLCRHLFNSSQTALLKFLFEDGFLSQALTLAADVLFLEPGGRPLFFATGFLLKVIAASLLCLCAWCIALQGNISLARLRNILPTRQTDGDHVVLNLECADVDKNFAGVIGCVVTLFSGSD